VLVLMAFTRNSLKVLAKKWIVALFNDILTSGKIPFKRVKVITKLKHGKDGSDPSPFWPILLLSIVFKILERLILQQIQPLNKFWS
jgi:hypothetical protein